MGAYDDNWRIIGVKNLAVNSSGGAVTSTTSVGSQTRAVDICAANPAASNSGVRFMISDMAADSITSVTGAVLPANWVGRYAITPGQKVQAIGHDSLVANLVIVELSK